MGFKGAMDLPIRTFWALNGLVNRVRAEEILDWLPAHASAMGGEGVKNLADSLEARMGNPVVFGNERMGANAKSSLRKNFG